MNCTHVEHVRKVTPATDGCAECLKIGQGWVHLRLCRSCGHVGCCDESPGRHATRHFETTAHPVIESYYPADPWLWCYLDEEFVEIEASTPHPQGWAW